MKQEVQNPERLIGQGQPPPDKIDLTKIRPVVLEYVRHHMVIPIDKESLKHNISYTWEAGFTTSHFLMNGILQTDMIICGWIVRIGSVRHVVNMIENVFNVKMTFHQRYLMIDQPLRHQDGFEETSPTPAAECPDVTNETVRAYEGKLKPMFYERGCPMNIKLVCNSERLYDRMLQELSPEGPVRNTHLTVEFNILGLEVPRNWKDRLRSAGFSAETFFRNRGNPNA